MCYQIDFQEAWVLILQGVNVRTGMACSKQHRRFGGGEPALAWGEVNRAFFKQRSMVERLMLNKSDLMGGVRQSS